MDEDWKNRLNNEEYKNWLKVLQALLQTKEALHDFSREVIERIHADIQKKTGSGVCDGTCNTNKGKQPSCPSCANWVKEIKSYKKGLLNWKNTDPKIWHDVPWEIAKCFMNPQGSKTTASANTGPDKTDLSGILNVLVNCKEFADVYLKEKKHPQTVREIRNKVMHSATMRFTEDVMKDYVNCMIAFLEDEKHLKNLKICNEKVRLLKSLRDGGFEICPEVEIDCLEGILKSDKLLVESGGEVDVAFRSSFNDLSRYVEHLISDLEKRMDSKIDRVEDRFETRMTSCDFNYGELKGSVEWLVNRVSELEKKCGVIPDIAASAASSRDAKQNDKLQFKNSLQCYAQKKRLGIPEYMHKETDDHKFISTVSVGDKQFESKEPKGNKKEADQSAAEMALTEFTSEVSSKNKEEDATSLPSNGDPAGSAKMPKDKSVSYKNQLQELAQQQTPVMPIYEREKTEEGLFLSKVFFDGRWYTPDTAGHTRKIDADQKAAEFVLAYLETNKETSPESSASLSPRPAAESSDGEKQNERSMTGESKEKDTSSMEACSVLSSLNNKPPQTDLPSNALISTGTIDATDSPDDKKTFKSKLNEYAQRQSPGVPPKYEDIECSPGYRSKVTIMDRTFEGEIPQSGKKEAREMVAMEAWNAINRPVLSPTSSPSSVNIKVDVPLSSRNDGSFSGEDSTIQCSSPEKKDSKSNGLHDASLEISTPKCLPPVLDQDFDPLALLGKRSTRVGVSTASGSSELGTVDEDVQNQSSETVPTCQSDGRKMFRSKLNEYLQTVGSANATYVEINGDSAGYRYKVTVLGKTYEGKSPEKTKKEAKEEAAKQACLSLGLEQDSSDNGSPESPGTSTDACGKCPMNEVEANLVLGETLAEDDEERNSKETIARDALKTDGSKDKGVDIEQTADTAAPSNYKAVLIGYANQSKIKPMYVTKPVGGTKEYVSKVFLGKRCYKGKNASRKKEAELNAAKVASEELVGPGSRESIAGNCEEFLVTYHENMEVNSDFPKYDEITSTNGAGVVVMATVVKKWKVSLVGARTKKKDFEERLAEEAIKVLEEEKKVVPAVESGNCRARLHQFCQQHRNAPAPSYHVLDSEPANFSGNLMFYTVEKYESLSPKPSKDEAIASAAKSACNDLDLI